MIKDTLADEFINAIVEDVDYWLLDENKKDTVEKTLVSMVFSILCNMDGVSSTPPSLLRDKETSEEINNDDMLHDYCYTYIKGELTDDEE